MVKLIATGLGLVILTVSIHALGTEIWVRVLKTYRTWLTGSQIWPTFTLLIATAVFMLSLNALEAIAWAGVYWLMPGIPEINTLETAIYFSLITFTTLGYGDIILSNQWQLLSGMEAMNGIFLFGWSSALLYAVVQRIWGEPQETRYHDKTKR